MKISACVVLYNPSDECLQNIRSYLSLVDFIYVLANSTQYNIKVIKELQDEVKVDWINLNGNQGIAYALRVGLQKSIENDFDLCLTMDQDSAFPDILRNDLEKRFSEIKLSDYGIIGLNFNADMQEKKLVETRVWITSGNFIVLENYKRIHGFRTELFIDYVDFELNEQFYCCGKRVAYWQDISLKHQIGNPRTYKIFWKKFTIMNHSPIRYYYRYRNSLYLYRKNKRFYRNVYYHDMFIGKLKILLFEKEKRLKFKLIRKGRKDAKLCRLGKYVE